MIKYDVLYTLPLAFHILTTTDHENFLNNYTKTFKGILKHNNQKYIIFVALNKFDFWESYKLLYFYKYYLQHQTKIPLQLPTGLIIFFLK